MRGLLTVLFVIDDEEDTAAHEANLKNIPWLPWWIPTAIQGCRLHHSSNDDAIRFIKLIVERSPMR